LDIKGYSLGNLKLSLLPKPMADNTRLHIADSNFSIPACHRVRLGGMIKRTLTQQLETRIDMNRPKS
jgi:starvation-inducible outer membrane lipoprotein